MNIVAQMREQDGDYRPDKALVDSYQFVLEYVHAVWSCTPELADERTELDEGQVAAVFETLEELRHAAMLFTLSRALALAGAETGVMAR